MNFDKRCSTLYGGKNSGDEFIFHSVEDLIFYFALSDFSLIIGLEFFVILDS